jgi:hypothetical protein
MRQCRLLSPALSQRDIRMAKIGSRNTPHLIIVTPIAAITE